MAAGRVIIIVANVHRSCVIVSSVQHGRRGLIVPSDRFERLLFELADAVHALHVLVEPRRQRSVGRHYLTLEQKLQRADLPIVDDVNDAQSRPEELLVVLSELGIQVLQQFTDSLELKLHVDRVDRHGHPRLAARSFLGH